MVVRVAAGCHSFCRQQITATSNTAVSALIFSLFTPRYQNTNNTITTAKVSTACISSFLTHLLIIMRGQHREQRSLTVNLTTEYNNDSSGLRCTVITSLGPNVGGRFRSEIGNLVTNRVSNTELYNLPLHILTQAKLSTI